MRQRVMIAMALDNNPMLLIADEPTTAVEVTIQAQVLDLIRGLSREFNSSVIFITHNLGIIASIAARVVVMYAGRVMETGSVSDIFYHPTHPYTHALLASIPRLDQPRGQPLTPIPGRDPYSSLDPRKTVLQIVSEPLDNFPESLANGHGRRSRRAVVEEKLPGHWAACHVPGPG